MVDVSSKLLFSYWKCFLIDIFMHFCVFSTFLPFIVIHMHRFFLFFLILCDFVNTWIGRCYLLRNLFYINHVSNFITTFKFSEKFSVKYTKMPLRKIFKSVQLCLDIVVLKLYKLQAHEEIKLIRKYHMFTHMLGQLAISFFVVIIRHTLLRINNSRLHNEAQIHSRRTLFPFGSTESTCFRYVTNPSNGCNSSCRLLKLASTTC